MRPGLGMGLLPVMVERGDTPVVALATAHQQVSPGMPDPPLQPWQAAGNDIEQVVKVVHRGEPG